MARGKNIQLYLMDGDVNGRIKCTLANWTGLAFKIPRTSLDVCKDRPELKQTGVYFLYFAELAVVTSLKFTFAFIGEGSGWF